MAELGIPSFVLGTTNQIFPILSDALLEELGKSFTFVEQERVSDTHRAVRFCTSWATTRENTNALCDELRRLAEKHC